MAFTDGEKPLAAADRPRRYYPRLTADYQSAIHSLAVVGTSPDHITVK